MALHALPSPEPDEPPFDMLVKGKAVEVALGRGLSTTTIEETIEGSPTVTVNVSDQPRALLSAGLLDHDDNGRLDADLDLVMLGATWRLAAFSKSGDMFTLRFEDAGVWILKRHTGRLRPKSGTDHVAFARRLVEDAGLRFVTVGATPAAEKTSRTKIKDRHAANETHAKGIAQDAKITIRSWDGISYTFRPGELQNAETILDQCVKDKAPERATLAALCAGIVEAPFFRNSGVATDHTSTGVFQLLSSTASGLGVSALDIAACTHLFLTKGFWKFPGAIALSPTGRSIGIIAADVEGCAAQYRGRYDQVLAGARKVLAAYGGAGLTVDAGGSGGATAAPALVVARGTTEDPEESSWKALQRMAGVKGYRVWAVRNTIHYCRERDLIGSRPRLVISEQSDGVDWIDYEWLPGAKVNSCDVQLRVAVADRVPPGSCVVLNDSGPADGRWIMATGSRGRFTAAASVTLRRGTELIKPQPATERVSPALSSGGSLVTLGGSVSGRGATGDSVKGGRWSAPAGGAHSFKGPEAALLNELAGIAQNDFHLTITATTNGNHVNGSYHFQGRAFDAAGSEGNMRAYCQYLLDRRLVPRLRELIHNPGFGVKDGRRVNGAVVFSRVWEGHRDHVHNAA